MGNNKKSKLSQIANYVFMIISFCIAIIFGYYDKTTQMITMVAFFIFFGIIAYINNFDYFKFSKDGIVAKLNRIDHDITTIQDIASTLASTELSTLSRAGKWGGISKIEKEKIKEDLVYKLKEIGISDDKINKDILNNWNDYTLVDYYYTILNKVGHFLDSTKRNDFILKFQTNEKNLLATIKDIDEIVDFITKNNIKDEKLFELIEDYKYFKKEKKHKSMEKWMEI